MLLSCELNFASFGLSCNAIRVETKDKPIGTRSGFRVEWKNEDWQNKEKRKHTASEGYKKRDKIQIKNMKVAD